MTRKKIVAGNFKMNGTIASVKEIVENLNQVQLDGKAEVVIAPTSMHLLLVREHCRKDIKVAAQNVYSKDPGAYTGEISPTQLTDAGITWVILGHSERRVTFKESEEDVAKKVTKALGSGLNVILCIGETLEEREKDATIEVLSKQLEAVREKISDWSKVVIAYEPIWAIGTGKVATPEQAQEVCKAVRERISKEVSAETSKEIRILYGGSVNEKNCKDLINQEDIDGFLVGGASLKPDFGNIINLIQPLPLKTLNKRIERKRAGNKAQIIEEEVPHHSKSRNIDEELRDVWLRTSSSSSGSRKIEKKPISAKKKKRKLLAGLKAEERHDKLSKKVQKSEARHEKIMSRRKDVVINRVE